MMSMLMSVLFAFANAQRSQAGIPGKNMEELMFFLICFVASSHLATNPEASKYEVPVEIFFSESFEWVVWLQQETCERLRWHRTNWRNERLIIKIYWITIAKLGYGMLWCLYVLVSLFSCWQILLSNLCFIFSLRFCRKTLGQNPIWSCDGDDVTGSKCFKHLRLKKTITVADCRRNPRWLQSFVFGGKSTLNS